ncbi:hypothetical protein ABNF97_01445 [Plantactinospora sp. B6F1]|uniref:hypothetical protein n=1 Tax=Plantactinospora sp. B6F1 TaxID=3158971 RepID=UPI00102C42DC
MCPLIAVRQGIGITVDEAVAERVTAGELAVCWSGSCRTHTVVLEPSTRVVDEDCTGSGSDDVCAAHAEPTGEKSGFVDLPDMPSDPVEVTVRLTDPAGSRIVNQRLTLDPTLVDGPGECGGAGEQGRIAVDAEGTARAVR